MRGLILAAGRGSRMRALTEDRPKGMVTLAGRTLIEWQLKALHAAGVDTIGVVSGYKGEALGRYPFAKRFENVRWAETNMVRSLTMAREWLVADVTIVSYSDIFYGADTVRQLKSAQADIAITYDPNWYWLWSRRFADPLSDAETFKLGPSGDLAEIGRKPLSSAEVMGQYMGLLRFNPAGWATIEDVLAQLTREEVDKLDVTSLLGKCLGSGIRIAALPITGQWGEADSDEDLRLYEDLMKRGEMSI